VKELLKNANEYKSCIIKKLDNPNKKNIGAENSRKTSPNNAKTNPIKKTFFTESQLAEQFE